MKVSCTPIKLLNIIIIIQRFPLFPFNYSYNFAKTTRTYYL